MLYLLHGGGDDQSGWVRFGEVQHIADRAIREGIATPMITVMPDANTGRRGHFNDLSGEWRFHDGGHTWTYWRGALPAVLGFVSLAFQQY